MAKKHLLSIQTAKKDAFVYTVPMSAYDATRILVVVDVATISITVLDKVLRGLRRANPNARILIVSAAYHETPTQELFAQRGVFGLMDDNMRAADVGDLRLQDYENLLDKPLRYEKIQAPEYIAEYDCCVSVSTMPSIKNIEIMLSPDTYNELDGLELDVYFTIGHFFDGAVIDLNEQVVWGDDTLGVDETAYRLTNTPVPDHLDIIRQMRETLL